MDHEYRLRAWGVTCALDVGVNQLGQRVEGIKKALELKTQEGDEFALRSACDALREAAYVNTRIAELFGAMRPEIG